MCLEWSGIKSVNCFVVESASHILINAHLWYLHSVNTNRCQLFVVCLHDEGDCSIIEKVALKFENFEQWMSEYQCPATFFYWDELCSIRVIHMEMCFVLTVTPGIIALLFQTWQSALNSYRKLTHNYCILFVWCHQLDPVVVSCELSCDCV